MRYASYGTFVSWCQADGYGNGDWCCLIVFWEELRHVTVLLVMSLS